MFFCRSQSAMDVDLGNHGSEGLSGVSLDPYQAHQASLDQCVRRIGQSLARMRYALSSMGVRQVTVAAVDTCPGLGSEPVQGQGSCEGEKSLPAQCVQQVPREVRYFHFPLSLGYTEDTLSRDLLPTLPETLELHRLVEHYQLERLHRAEKSAFVFLGQELPDKTGHGGAFEQGQGKGLSHGRGSDSHQVLFLRSLLRDLDPGLDPGLVLQSDLLRSLDELERARLEPHVNPSASARLFFALAGHPRPWTIIYTALYLQ